MAAVASNSFPLFQLAFAMGLFGSGILYLSVRHSVDNPPLWVHSAALVE